MAYGSEEIMDMTSNMGADLMVKRFTFTVTRGMKHTIATHLEVIKDKGYIDDYECINTGWLTVTFEIRGADPLFIYGIAIGSYIS